MNKSSLETDAYFIICGIWLTGALFAATITPFVATWNLDACINQATLSTDSFGTLVVAVLIAIVCPAVAIVYCTTQIFFAILRTQRQITAQVNSIGGENGSLATTPSFYFHIASFWKKRAAHMPGVSYANYSVCYIYFMVHV